MIKFLCDAQLPPVLCKKLNENGYEATHVIDIGLLYAKDSEIWRYALNHTMIIMTKDSDFAQRPTSPIFHLKLFGFAYRMLKVLSSLIRFYP